MSDILTQFKEIFEGFSLAHGRYTLDEVKSTDIKVGARDILVRKEITLSAFEEHLKGQRGVQITPVNENGKCRFGCIDVDEHNLSAKRVEAIVLQIKSKGLPLIAVSAKSKGLHIFIFFKLFVDAKLVKDKLRKMAGFLELDLSKVEIFPKQSTLLYSEGHTGSRISLPYFANFTKEGTRECAYNYVSDKLVKLSFQEFIDKAKELSLSLIAFKKIKIELPTMLEEAPPCLDSLCYKGVAEFRNMFITNLAIYAKRIYPDTWKNFIERANEKYCIPEISKSELVSTVRSVAGNEYGYMCSQCPLVSNCNAKVCKQRKYGIGSGNGLPINGSIIKLKTTPPLWFIGLDSDDILTLTTEELQSQTLFQRACMDKLNLVPKTIKKAEWESALQELLLRVEEEEAPISATPLEMMKVLLTKWLYSPNTKEDVRGLTRGFPVKRENVFYFVFSDFVGFLDRNRFNETKGRNKQINLLRQLGCKSTNIVVQRERINVLSIKSYKSEEDDEELVDPF